MKTKQIVLTCLQLIICGLLIAQETAQKKYTPVNVQLMAGSINSYGGSNSLQDFQDLFPNSELLNNDLSDFKSNKWNTQNNAFALSALVAFKKADNNKLNYRFGLSYFSGNGLNNYLSKETKNPYDTLESASTGKQIFIDSTYHDTYSLSYYYQQLSVEGAMTYGTNPTSKFSFYGGVGVSLGFRFNTETLIEHSSFTRYESENKESDYDSFISEFDHRKTEEESVKNKSGISLGGFLPLGVNFRI